jgi:tetrahydromethanopterin S-methyltransferase subunit G
MMILGLGAAVALAPSSVTAQRQPPSPEQRLDRLERQVQQVQRQVFPKGRPADTAGFPDDPAATQASVMSLDQRLDALERQMQDLLRASEENGNRLRGIESGVARVRADLEQRIAAI